MALEGVAGAGKTCSLAAIREAAAREGYKLEGLAPTSRAAQKLAEAGIESNTLQRQVARNQEAHDGQRRLYVLDESSLASTKQVNRFLHRLRREDRVLFVGDTRQHQAVEAGAPYQQLQDAGMTTARLDEIVRQKNPALKDVVEKFSRGHVREAIEKLDTQGRVHEIPDRDERLAAIAQEYVKQPESTLVVSPDNRSRTEINQAIHYAMQDAGKMPYREHEMRVLVARQEITGPDRQWAAQYEPGDIVRYTRGSKTHGVEAGEYVRVERVNDHLPQTARQLTFVVRVKLRVVAGTGDGHVSQSPHAPTRGRKLSLVPSSADDAVSAYCSLEEFERKAEGQAENRGATIEIFVNNDNEEKISKGLLGSGTQMPSPSPDPFSC